MGLDFTIFRRKCSRFKEEVGLEFDIFRRKCSLLKQEVGSVLAFSHYVSSSLRGWPCRSGRSVGRQFAFSYSFSTTRPRFARAKSDFKTRLPLFSFVGSLFSWKSKRSRDREKKGRREREANRKSPAAITSKTAAQLAESLGRNSKFLREW